MRKLFGFLALGAMLSIGLTTSAGAVPLGGATLSVSLTGLPGATFIGSVSGTATSHGNVTIGTAGFVTGSATASPTNPATVTNVVISVGGNTGGTFLGSGTGTVGATGMGPGGLRGTMLVTGTANVKGLGVTLLPVPLKQGQPSTQIVTGTGIALTIFNNSWTANTANVTFTSMNMVASPLSVTLSYFFHIPASGSSNMYQTGTTTVTTTQSITVSQMGSLLASTAASNTFSIVTPTKVLTTLAASPVVPAFARLTVHLAVPEAGTLLLLGSGALGLLVIGRKKGRN